MKFHSFIFFTLLNINILVGQYFELPRLGVLDFEPRAVPISLTQRFTEAFRNELENTNLAQVIDRGSLLSVVEERGYIRSNCITDYCEALVGRLLDADFILSGSIAYADSTYTIDINMAFMMKIRIICPNIKRELETHSSISFFSFGTTGLVVLG